MANISCHSNQSSHPIGTKQNNNIISPPDYRFYMWNMVKIGFMASEDMSIKNVDDGRTTDAWLYCKPPYEPSAQVSL